MRTEKQIYDTILNFAKADDRIRVVTLEGSRTNINIIPDDFQDYDITFFVTDMQSFINSDEWLNVFGERLIMQKPEDMELFPKEEKGYSYLMLFWDGVKIDLTLLPLEVLDEYFTWDKLVKLMPAVRCRGWTMRPSTSTVVRASRARAPTSARRSFPQPGSRSWSGKGSWNFELHASAW